MIRAILEGKFFDRLLERTGGYYLVTAIGIAQLVVTPLGIFLSAVILFFNAEMSVKDVTTLGLITAGLMVVRNILLLLGTHVSNRDAVQALSRVKSGISENADPAHDKRAWRQITNLPWRYIAVAFSTLMLFVLFPILLVVKNILSGSQDQVVYTIIAGIVSGLALAILEVLLIEQMLTRAREKLVPMNFENQLHGVPGFRLFGKFLVILFSLILISVLLVAPIGYHQTTRVLFEEIGSLQVLSDLQTQSIIVAVAALILGLGLAYLVTRGISKPISQMIEVFKRVEVGDISQRVKVTATDEIGELAIYFNRMADRLESLQTDLENQVTERTEQLRVTNEVGQIASTILEPDALITKVVNLITERLGHYYAAIFLIDASGHWAELKDATGTAGQVLKNRGHRLEIGGRSMVSAAIMDKRGRIALDVGKESIRFDNPLLPDTHSEIALPLITGSKVLGALDVQSIKEAAFDEESISTLQGMANQVAIALENARLFQEIQANLEELRSAHRLYVSEAWLEKSQEHLSFEYEASFNLGPDIRPTETIHVPLTLREQSIGQIQVDGDNKWSAEERNLIEAVATQAALALENARLLEKSQQMALNERLTSEIIAKIWSAPNMEQVLQTAVKEIGRALRADETTIELEIE